MFHTGNQSPAEGKEDQTEKARPETDWYSVATSLALYLWVTLTGIAEDWS